jgi:hypothetical protein
VFGIMRRSRKFWLIVAALYAFTWGGGWISHQRGLSAHARQLYVQAQQREIEEVALYKQEGSSYQPRRITRDGGPIARVNWCVPVLPGVLIANSHYVIGPLYARGGVSIVLYYGFGCHQFGSIGGWIS